MIGQTRFSDVALPAEALSHAALRRCLHHLGKGQLDPAEECCREALEALPGSGAVWYLFGLLAARRNRPEEAIERLSRALELVSDAVPALRDRALLLQRLGRREEALADCERAASLAPEDARVWHERGLALARLGRHREALASLDRSLSLSPHDGDVEIARGDALGALGRSGDALAAFERALALAPANAAALIGSGKALSALGRHREALARHDRALARTPESAAAHSGRGVALAGLDRSAAALLSFARALALKADDAEAWLNNGNVLRKLNRFEEALESFDRALALAPTLIDALHHRALTLYNLGRLELALDSYDRALAAAPDMAPALIGKGMALSHLGRRVEALECFGRALTLVPESSELKVLHADLLDMLRHSQSKAEVQFLRGETFRLLERMSEAVAAYDAALALRSDFAEAWHSRGKALDAMREHADALASFDRASRLRPEWAEPHVSRCGTLRGMGRHEEALAAAGQALALDPQSIGALNARGNTLSGLGRVAEAIADFDRAIALRPEAPEPKFNRAFALLTAGDFERGWEAYEARHQLDAAAKQRDPFANRPRWQGEEDIVGKTVVLHAEQGYGDTIQFCRYAPLVAQRGARVLLGVQPMLTGLIASLAGPIEIVQRPGDLYDYDYHCPLLSLPHAMRTTPATIPDEVPYLRAPSDYRQRWRARLGAEPRPRIGLAWCGNKDFKDDHIRSLALEQLEPVLALGCDFYAVQRQLRPRDTPCLALYRNLRYFGPELRDFCDTAALMEEVDLVISSDTAVAHLAGALGRPVWVMLNYAADFRWMRQRRDSPWYPTMRLFRQPRPGDWPAVIDNVREELATFCSSAYALA